MPETTDIKVYETTTPAGIEVRYTPAPKRKYEVRQTFGEDDTPYAAGSTPWREVPSVTTVLGVLDKPALPWWGMQQGVEGVLELVRRRVLRETMWPDTEGGICGFERLRRDELGIEYLVPAEWERADVAAVVDLLTHEKMTVNHVRDKAASRGTAVHDAFELWCREGHKPDPAMFSEEEAGYVRGLLAFLADVDPEPLDCEVMVGSVEHGFAGRYDVRLRIPAERKVVFKTTPKKGAHYALLEPGTILADLKTSSGVYPTSHFRQLEAYELASIECGYEPTDARGVIHVSKDGTYEFVRSTAIAQDFLDVLAVWRGNENLKRRGK